MRVDLDTPTDYFAALFDKGNGISVFVGLIQAYDSTGTLLEEAFTEPAPGNCCSIDPTWATISRSTNDIAYIQATAWGGTVASIDTIEFNAVPVPAAVWLFGSGLIGLIGLARRKASV